MRTYVAAGTSGVRAVEEIGGLKFLILGPLEVVDGERLIALGGAKQRLLLAILILHANQVVSTDLLCAELSTGRSSSGALASLYVHVSNLRRLLEASRGPNFPPIIETRKPGYVLRVRADQLDVLAFHALVAEARSAVREHRPAEAAVLLGQALGLWRGPALADLAHGPFVQTRGVFLEEARLAALEDRIEADLLLGRHAELVGELRVLVAEHPSREEFHRQLMLALYRCGRQAEALAVYQETRRSLIKGFGIEPSPALRSLEQAILRQDPTI
ncbi:MAG: AfsR/SARP family transcriptional regulator [Egibacteraceae bacterium]